MFYYEVYESEFDEDEKAWSAFDPEKSFETSVVKPNTAKLEGFDVVSFSTGNNPECSPLSCNSLAGVIPVNQNCLFASFAEAKEALEVGKFIDSDHGPYRIFAVYSVQAE